MERVIGSEIEAATVRQEGSKFLSEALELVKYENSWKTPDAIVASSKVTDIHIANCVAVISVLIMVD